MSPRRTNARDIRTTRGVSKMKTTGMLAVIVALLLGGGTTAIAQTAPGEPRAFLNISVGGQVQSRTFSETTTFVLFNETGSIVSNQTVGGGLVFDATFGYHVWNAVAFAVGVSTFNGSGEAAVVASIPSSIFIGLPVVWTFGPSDYGDLSQTNTAVNFLVVFVAPVSDRFDVAISAGPSVIRVKQEVASATANINSTATINSQSGTTAKAGTVGLDLSYRMNNRYSLGGFLRYMGGVVDLPAVPDMSVGGFQAGGGIRFRF
jgi:hypothetical protein